MQQNIKFFKELLKIYKVSKTKEEEKLNTILVNSLTVTSVSFFVCLFIALAVFYLIG